MDNENIAAQIAAETLEDTAAQTEVEIIEESVDDDVILPEDYKEGEPYAFEVPDGDLTETDGDPAQLSDDPSAGADEGQEQPVSDQPSAGEEPAPADPSAQEAEPAPGTYKFTDTFQGMSREVEVNYSDIPNMYRKAQTADFVVRRTTEHEGKARALGYESVDDMLTKVRSAMIESEVASLVAENVHETIARDVVNRKYPEFARPAQTQQVQTNAAAPAQPTQNVRNIDNELAELHVAYPALRGQKLPQEVTNAAMGGKSLLNAYKDFLHETERGELSRLREENERLRQNAAAAAKAPVRGVTAGGATDTKPKDAFLMGFESAY